jgi:hypothetical protein
MTDNEWVRPKLLPDHLKQWLLDHGVPKDSFVEIKVDELPEFDPKYLKGIPNLPPYKGKS